MFLFHRTGHTRKISIPDCIEFMITTNACRGYCESFAIPSAFAIGVHRPEQPITSVGQCCNIMESEDVQVKVRCLDGKKGFKLLFEIILIEIKLQAFVSLFSNRPSNAAAITVKRTNVETLAKNENCC